MMIKVLGKNGNDSCHENSKNMAFHLQYAQCYTASTSFLMSHLLMRTIFNYKTCQQFCKFQITSLSDALSTESLELPNVS